MANRNVLNLSLNMEMLASLMSCGCLFQRARPKFGPGRTRKHTVVCHLNMNDKICCAS